MVPKPWTILVTWYFSFSYFYLTEQGCNQGIKGIIRRGSWKLAWHRVILRGAPRRLTFACSPFIVYCNVFRRLLRENYLKTTRWDKANYFRTVRLRIVSWILLRITGLKRWVICFVTPSISRGWERTKLRTRANSLSFPPRPLLESCFRHVCHVIELGRYSRMPLFKQCSCLLRFTWHFLFAENVFTFKRNYYSFKIFLQFWLAKSTPIIHNNQLLMTKFGRILCLTRKWRQKCGPLQVNAPLTEKTWRRGWIVLVVKTKMTDISLVSRVRTTAATRRNNS